jgi:hypothetical protein
MTRHRRLLLAACCTFLWTGCNFGDDDCEFDLRGAADLQAANDLRNPDTGICEPFVNPGGGCNDPCNCTDVPQAEPVPLPDWATCYSSCEALDETTCLATSACRAAYAGDTFYQCWSTAPSGPAQGGDCTTFGSYECSRHDDCVARHAVGAPIGPFVSCGPESGIPPDPGSCVGEVVCAEAPPACPPDTVAGRRDGCWTGFCIPLADCDQAPACSDMDEMGCIGRSDCAPVYEGQNCSCNGTSCTCQTWIFDACVDRDGA